MKSGLTFVQVVSEVSKKRHLLEEKLTACNVFLKEIEVLTSWVTSAFGQVLELDAPSSSGAIHAKVGFYFCYMAV